MGIDTDAEARSLNMDRRDFKLEKLAHSWVLAHRLGMDRVGYDKHKWAVDEVIELAFDQPDQLWMVIKKILELDGSAEIVGAVGAGPLEDLITRYGDRYIDAIEDYARTSDRLRAAIRGVWLDDQDTSLKDRFLAIGN